MQVERNDGKFFAEELSKMERKSEFPVDPMLRVAEEINKVSTGENKKVVVANLPELGKEFEINGLKYYVVYVKEGSGRFTAQLKGFVGEGA